MRFMTPFAILCLLLELFCTSHATAQPKNVQVSADSISAYGPEEVSIAINPKNPLEIVAGSNAHWVYSSTDGGNTWSSSILPSKYGGGGDPSLIFDNEGNLYNESLGYDRLGIDQLSDQGLIFNIHSEVGLDTSTVQDKPTLATDRRERMGSATALTWTRFNHFDTRNASDTSHVMCSVTRDHGLTWSDAVRVDDVGGDCYDSSNTVEGAVPAFGPNGELYVAWSARDTIFFDKSVDGGISFGRDKAIAVQPGGWWINERRIFRANGFPVIVCDQTSSRYNGGLYVVWGDTRRGVPDAYFIHSTDGGDTWSNPQNLTEADTAQHLFPALTVDPITGHIFVAYYSIHPEKSYSTDVLLARSTDGGETFTTSTVSQSSFSGGGFLGDYISVAAYDRHVVPAWTRVAKGGSAIWAALVLDTEGVASVMNPEMSSGLSLGRVSPNPASGSISIPISKASAEIIDLTLINLLGTTVLHQQIQRTSNSFTTQLRLGRLSPGCYQLAVRSGLGCARQMIVIGD